MDEFREVAAEAIPELLTRDEVEHVGHIICEDKYLRSTYVFMMCLCAELPAADSTFHIPFH